MESEHHTAVQGKAIATSHSAVMIDSVLDMWFGTESAERPEHVRIRLRFESGPLE